MTPPTSRARAPRADQSRMLEDDVAAMLKDALRRGQRPEEAAHDIIVVVRERVLQEIQSYARMHIR